MFLRGVASSTKPHTIHHLRGERREHRGQNERRLHTHQYIPTCTHKYIVNAVHLEDTFIQRNTQKFTQSTTDNQKCKVLTVSRWSEPRNGQYTGTDNPDTVHLYSGAKKGNTICNTVLYQQEALQTNKSSTFIVSTVEKPQVKK